MESIGAPFRGSICFVTADFPGVVRNGGVGTYVLLMSRLLARAGWDVLILFCGHGDNREALLKTPTTLAAEGIRFIRLDQLGAPAWLSTQRGTFGGGEGWSIFSDSVLSGLSSLQAKHHFDLIEFPDWGGLGFRSVQAKRSGLALGDVALAVKLHGPSRWQREGNLLWPSSPRDFNLDFCERYAFEHADVQFSPSQYMVGHARSLDWNVREDCVVSYPFPDVSASPAPVRAIRELVFFGRLERRKGLELFLTAVKSAPEDLSVLFLGRDTEIDGRKATDLIASRLGGRNYKVAGQLDREQALQTLRSGDRLAIIPSSTETFGFTVAECLAEGIPFLASRAGGIPEVIVHEAARDAWLFEPTVAGLTEALLHRLSRPLEPESELRTAALTEHAASGWNDRVIATYAGLSHHRVASAAHSTRARASSPSVTVAMAHYNQPRFLPDALASLAAQTQPPDEVIVVDDGSDDPEAQRVFARQEERYPSWTFLRQANQGPGVARNLCLTRARSDWLLPFDADNLARPELIATLLRAAALRPDLAAISCHYTAFSDERSLARQRYVFRFAPLGGPLIAACHENVYGDTCSLFATKSLRAAGGFESERWSPFEDYETFVKLVVAGHEVDVVPSVLFDYRDHSNGRMRQLTADPSTEFRHRQRLAQEFLSKAALSRRDKVELWEAAMRFGDITLRGSAPGAQQSRRTLTQRARDMRDLIAAERSLGKPPRAIGETVLRAITRQS